MFKFEFLYMRENNGKEMVKAAALLTPKYLAGAIFPCSICLLKMLNIYKEKCTDFSLTSQYEGWPRSFMQHD